MEFSTIQLSRKKFSFSFFFDTHTPSFHSFLQVRRNDGVQEPGKKDPQWVCLEREAVVNLHGITVVYRVTIAVYIRKVQFMRVLWDEKQKKGERNFKLDFLEMDFFQTPADGQN